MIGQTDLLGEAHYRTRQALIKCKRRQCLKDIWSIPLHSREWARIIWCSDRGRLYNLGGHALDNTEHSLLSSYREILLEHLFAGEVMRHLWISGTKRLEMLKPQVDASGYDLILEANAVVRHIQLKATFNGSKVKRFNVNVGLATKPSDCVIVLIFEQSTLKLGPFLWFGNAPGKKLSDLSGYRIAKHTKGNAEGKKLDRPQIRVVPRASFELIETIRALTLKLFGEK